MPYIEDRHHQALDMHVNKHFFLWLIILLIFPLTGAGQSNDADWLEQGLLAEFRGEHELALDIWLEARNELAVPDSRIGLEFIRLATERQLGDYFEAATDMYMWAISSPYATLNRSAIRQEIERLKPILGEGIYRQWLSWMEERDMKLAADMRGFWIQMDPTPGKIVNERLIEHWQRIAYAKAHFLQNKNTIYGADERSPIYIRYGNPDLTYTGVLSIDKQNLGRWLEQQFHAAEKATDPEDHPSIHSEEDFSESGDSFEQLNEYVFRFHEYPEYEIWIYEPLADNLREPLIYIFGTDVRTGEFHQVSSIDDFIPQRAYLSDQNSPNLQTRFTRQGLSPALALQLLYYEQLAGLNSYFQNRLNSIREAFVDQGPLTDSSLDLSMRSQSREMLDMREAEAPVEVSNLGRMIPQIPVDIHQYRFLDEDLNPVIISFLESNPAQALSQDLEGNPRHENETVSSDPDSIILDSEHLPDHMLNHTFIIYDDDWEETERNLHAPDIRFTESSAGHVVQSVFTSPHVSQRFQAASAQLINNNPGSITLYPSLFPEEVRGLGTLKNQQPSPLDRDPDSLQLGDLILGYHDEVPDDYPFLFRVANDQTISSDESLILHFEVYNLQPNPSTGFTRFELTYRIYPVLEDGTLLTDQEAFYLTINFEDDQTHVIEDLEIQTSSLSSGLYELQVYIEDMERVQQKNRNIRFEVTN